jgi:hypothetical protein
MSGRQLLSSRGLSAAADVWMAGRQLRSVAAVDRSLRIPLAELYLRYAPCRRIRDYETEYHAQRYAGNTKHHVIF